MKGGLHRGFSHHWARYADAEVVNREALAWLDAQPREPFFLFLFYMDTHFPYHPYQPPT